VRVVGGELGGRRLAAPPRKADVRPTSDRVREALFSILAGRVEGATVLDLFAGTGALSIEALSRGAAHATLVDDNTSLAQRNIDALELADRSRLVRSDVERFLARERKRFDLIFCDPPYRLADRLQAPLDKLLPDRVAAGGVVVVESAARTPLRLALTEVADRRYGDTRVTVYEGGRDG
jgi:16S rRNA (guanine966-N2)-methyltransferase